MVVLVGGPAVAAVAGLVLEVVVAAMVVAVSEAMVLVLGLVLEVLACRLSPGTFQPSESHVY